MKTVVITGSARGLGFEMAKQFRKHSANVVLCDVNEEGLERAKTELEKSEGNGGVIAVKADITKTDDLENLMGKALESFREVDIWINNAGVNQPMKALWELSETEIGRLIDIDLRGAVLGSKVAMTQMEKQGHGAIYNIDGYGSNDAKMLGLNMYGTCKRAVTHFTQALALESEERKTGVNVGRLSPGIMITEFITKPLGGSAAMELPEKTKKVYNILGDYPDVIAAFLVNKMVMNTKNNVKFEWLTGAKASWRFMTAGFNKRDFFK